MTSLDAIAMKLPLTTVTSNNGSLIMAGNDASYTASSLQPLLISVPDMSAGLVNLSQITVDTVENDYLFELIFLIGSTVSLVGLFFFLGAMFCYRRSFKALELDNYTKSADSGRGWNQSASPPPQPAYPQDQSRRVPSNNNFVAQPSGNNMSRRGSFNGAPNNNNFAAQPSGNNMSRRGSFNGAPNNVSMSRQGSQRRQTFGTEY